MVSGQRYTRGLTGMFAFKLDVGLRLLTVVRTGHWSLETVVKYEVALRQELARLHRLGPSTAFIIEIRSTRAQPKAVAEALRAMVSGLGELHATRTAVVAKAGVAKLQAKRVADDSAEVFTSMEAALDWAIRRGEPTVSGNVVHNEPSDVDAEGHTVRVQGPSDVDVSMTPGAALETAKRLEHAAIEALIGPLEAPAPQPSL